MRTLYVSDLDGTLLKSDETVSPFTAQTINELVGRGMLFSYATARSYQTAEKVTRGIRAEIPVIVYNGAMTVSSASGEVLASESFGSDVRAMIEEMTARGIYPVVYAVIGGRQRFSYLADRCTRGMQAYIASRAGDPRERPVCSVQALMQGEIFYVTCIDDDEEKLAPLYDAYRGRYRAVLAKDAYTKAYWLEFMPQGVCKANAAAKLKAALGAQRLVVFGDGVNDLDLFAIADEGYAVANAADALKAAATQVIASNDEDGVAEWLRAHAQV